MPSFTSPAETIGAGLPRSAMGGRRITVWFSIAPDDGSGSYSKHMAAALRVIRQSRLKHPAHSPVESGYLASESSRLSSQRA